MDTKEYAESNYVTVQLVKDSPTKRAKIISDASVTEAEFSGKKVKRIEFSVEIDGKTKTYSPNKDTLKNIHSVLGFESRNWLNKNIGFRVLSVNGKDSIIGTIE